MLVVCEILAFNYFLKDLAPPWVDEEVLYVHVIGGIGWGSQV
jgi:hypothetical protein